MTRLEILKAKKRNLEAQIRDEEVGKLKLEASRKIKKNIKTSIDNFLKELSFEEILNDKKFDSLTDSEKSDIVNYEVECFAKNEIDFSTEKTFRYYLL